MPYLEGALVAIDNAAAESARSSAGAIMRRANSIARSRRPIARSVPPSSRLSTRSPSLTDFCPARRSAMDRSQPGEIQGAGNWSPGNSDGHYGGIKPVSYGLIHSRNTMSVRVGEFAGLDDVQKIATTLGLGQDIPHGAGDLHRLLRNRPEGSDRRLHRFPKRRRPQTGLHHRANRRPGSQADLSRRPRHHAGARSGRGLDDDRS